MGGQTWVSGGSFIMSATNVGNSRAAFYGCYQEQGQPPFQGRYPAMVFGGNMDIGSGPNGTGILGDAGFIGATANAMARTIGGLSVLGQDTFGGLNNRVINYGGGEASNIFDATLSATAGDNVQLEYNNIFGGGGNLTLNLTTGNSKVIAAFFTGQDTTNYGNGSAYFPRLFVGPDNVGTRIGVINNLAALNSLENGLHAFVGDRFFFNQSLAGNSYDGVVCVTAGTINGTAVFKNFGRIPGSTTFAFLPSSPSVGDIFAITDSTTNTWGATVAGSGGNYALINWNGTNWTVIGK
jgi:hypothetical protein